MLVKIHQAYRYIVAICDEELLGKRFEEDKIVLEVKEKFFKGDVIEEKELSEIMYDMATEDATFNIIGEKSINLALQCGIIVEEGVKRVQGIPFAIVLL